MKPRVLALDFDGTIAVNDTIDGDVAAAIQEARRAGLLVVLVTGRILSDLETRFSDAPPFDAIVAENGAVLKLSDLPSPSRSARTRTQVFLPSSEDGGSGINRVNASSRRPPTRHRRSSRLSARSESPARDHVQSRSTHGAAARYQQGQRASGSALALTGVRP